MQILDVEAMTEQTAVNKKSSKVKSDKPEKFPIRKWVGIIHLWLGLASGLVVFTVAITGCIYAFEKEIQDATQPYRFIETSSEKTILLPTQLATIAEKQFDSLKTRRIQYNGVGRSATVQFFGPKGEYYYVYVNPYSGEVLKVKNMRTDFFTIILYLHYSLLLPYIIGGPIVSSATIIFVVMLISGIVLWWPKNKNARKQRFSIKWSASWKRKNYDLHNVLGFYMTWVVLFIALTGLVWGFEWFSKSVYWISSAGESMPEYKIPHSDTLAAKATVSVTDQTFLKVMEENNAVTTIGISFPGDAKDVISVYSNPDPDTYYKMDFRYFDQNTMKEYSVDHYRGKYAEANGPAMLQRLNYDIHVGAIFGLPGKILAFCASLVAASLPVTGFLIWRGRRRKKR